jgi:hypothetical protein
MLAPTTSLASHEDWWAGSAGIFGAPGPLTSFAMFDYPNNVAMRIVTEPIGSPCPADINADGVVNVDDLLAVISAWGNCAVPPAACPANIVNTGTSANRVDVDDLLAVISAWGPCE